MTFEISLSISFLIFWYWPLRSTIEIVGFSICKILDGKNTIKSVIKLQVHKVHNVGPSYHGGQSVVWRLIDGFVKGNR